jgi:2-octaprenyl-6-methoxyphenol hydroxylase
MAVVDLDYDVLVVGAGLIGSTLVAALSQTNMRVGWVEAQEQVFGSDGRSSALALGTTEILKQVQAWSFMERSGVSPIDRIQISDGSSTQTCELHSTDIQVQALGYVVDNQLTQTALRQVIHQAPHIQSICPARVTAIDPQASFVGVRIQHQNQDRILKVQLILAADGSRSLLRDLAGISQTSWEYGQVCIVSTVTTEYPHQQVAYERFQPSGPFAILPMTAGSDSTQASHRSCVVWTARAHDRDRILSLSERDFLAAMAPSFGSQLGALLSATRPQCYVPRRLHSHRYCAPRLVLVGDAAHTTHPLGGQGINMGMRDVAVLANVLSHAYQKGQDLGQADLLRQYEQSRWPENQGILLATDMANRVFSNTCLPLTWGRRFALQSLNYLDPIKHLLMRQAMGIAPYQARLQLAQV